MLILKKGHQPGVYVPLRALFLVNYRSSTDFLNGAVTRVLLLFDRPSYMIYICGEVGEGCAWMKLPKTECDDEDVQSSVTAHVVKPQSATLHKHAFAICSDF